MIWPVVYAGRRDELEANSAAQPLLDELDLTTRLSKRAAAMFAATGASSATCGVPPPFACL